MDKFVRLKMMKTGCVSYSIEDFPERPDIDRSGNTDTMPQEAEFYGKMSEKLPQDSRVVLVVIPQGRSWMHLAKTKWVANANQEAKNSRILIFEKY
tara:strand:- start:1001 stop:1288 length:288 start_codon:yes stop_codon:yes gene_type:complete